jgi:glutamine cyclotransferase
MRKHIIYFLAISLIGFTACKSSKPAGNMIEFKSPESGSELKAGSALQLELNLHDTEGIDSVVYFLDEQKLVVLKAAEPYTLATDSLKMGNRILTARVYRGSDTQEGSASVLIKPTKAPEKWKYRVEATFPHDTSSYTQGLEFHAGIFYESDGEYGSSTVRKVDPKSGKILKLVDFPDDYFAEGLTVLGKHVVLLTWQEKMGFVLDKSSLEMLSDFPYQNSREGWGLCNDGKKFYKSDGSNMIYFLNPETYQEEGFIEVYDQNGAVDQLNELEFIDGQLFANIYQSRRVVVIDPKTGAVTAEIDFSGLSVNNSNADVLNGIAHDAATGRIWVTGKKWNKLFQIKLLK